MTRPMMLICACLCAMAFVVAAHPAEAQIFNSFLSNAGSDNNDCTAQSPCASLIHALSVTLPYGQVNCLDGGEYASINAINVTQSVTIDCAGGAGSATIASLITVNGAGIIVRLRNLTLNGVGRGAAAIEAQNMGALYVENCVITNYNSTEAQASPYIGIEFEPSANAQLFVSNSVISNNGNSGGITGGIYIVPASGMTATVSIDRSQITGNTFGIVADGTSGGTIKGTISDSVVSGNSEDGIAAISSGSPVWFLVDQTKVAGNAYGLAAGGSGGEILARYSSIFDNATGLHTSGGGALYSYGTTSLNGNATNGAFTGTIGLQ
jgi:hypothetical protein